VYINSGGSVVRRFGIFNGYSEIFKTFLFWKYLNLKFKEKALRKILFLSFIIYANFGTSIYFTCF